MRQFTLFLVILALSASAFGSFTRIPHPSGVDNIYYPSVSADGRYIAYLGGPTVRGNLNSSSTLRVYVYDRTLGTTTCVSPSTQQIPAAYHATRPKISRDGYAVTFFFKNTSSTSVPFKPCCAIRSGTTWTDELMLTLDGNTPISTATLDPSVTPPGVSNNVGVGTHWVCFESLVATVIPGSTYYQLVRWNAGSSTDGTSFNYGPTTDYSEPDLDSAPNHLVFVRAGQIYRAPCWSGAVELVSAVNGNPCAGAGCASPSIDSNGTDITYSSTAYDLPAHTNNQDIYWAEAPLGAWSSSLVSLGGVDSTCALPSMSSNATYISFESNGQLTVDHTVVWGGFNGVGAFLEKTGATSTLDLDSYHQPITPWREPRRGYSSVCDDSGECVFASDDDGITSSGDNTYPWDIFIFTP